MTNQELLKKAREAGFDLLQSGYTTALDGNIAVLLPKGDLDSLDRLINKVSTLRDVQYRFHSFVVRAKK